MFSLPPLQTVQLLRKDQAAVDKHQQAVQERAQELAATVNTEKDRQLGLLSSQVAPGG